MNIKAPMMGANMNRKIITLIMLITMMPGIVLAQSAVSESTIVDELGSKAAKIAMEELKFEKGDRNILALTDAGYAEINGLTTQEALSAIAKETGMNEGEQSFSCPSS